MWQGVQCRSGFGQVNGTKLLCLQHNVNFVVFSMICVRSAEESGSFELQGISSHSVFVAENKESNSHSCQSFHQP